jgi:hypothetical protein
LGRGLVRGGCVRRDLLILGVRRIREQKREHKRDSE